MNLDLALLQSSVWLAAGWFGYQFLLRNTRQFALNRAYLWLVMSGALLLPMLSPTLSGLVPKASIQAPALWLDLVSVEQGAETAKTSSFSWFAFLYVGGMALVALRLLRNLWQIGMTIRQAKPALLDGRRVRLNSAAAQIGSSYSFMGYVILDPTLLHDAEARERILAHERAHSRQGHSLDALAAELLCALFWFNPFCWALRRCVAENNEFLADRAALQQRPGTRAYAELLLRVSGLSPDKRALQILPVTGLIQPFHSSQTKRRLIMLSKNFTIRFSMLRYAGAFLMVFSVLTFSVAAQQVTRTNSNIQNVVLSEEASPNAQQDQQQDLEKNPDVMAEFPGGMEALFSYLGKEIKYPNAAKKEGVSGKCFLQFVVDTDGTIRDAVVLKGFHPDCDAEALRVVREMPKWKAGQKDGKNVATQLVLPIHFSLN